MQDRYSRKRIPLKLKMYTLENEYLKAEFLPEYSGRLYSLFDKVNNIDLVMKNPVIQPGNLAIRNAWLSGGIEWNIGSVGHTYTTCDNVFCAILDDRAVERMLKFVDRIKSMKKGKSEYSREVQHQVARDAAAECITLLRNDDNVLPINGKKYKKIGVFGKAAERPVIMGGGSSHILLEYKVKDCNKMLLTFERSLEDESVLHGGYTKVITGILPVDFATHLPILSFYGVKIENI